MASTWEEFLKKTEDPSPGEAVVKATIEWFTKELQISSPMLADGHTEDAVASQLPKELPVAACVRRVLRAVEAVAQARRTARVGGASPAGVASAHSLAKMLAPGKTADVAHLLSKAGLKNTAFGLQAEQLLWNNMQQHTDECKQAGKVAFLFVDLTCKEALPMWLTPDLIRGKFQIHDDGELPLQGQVPISSLQDLGKALKSAAASPRFFRTVGQWSGAFLRYAVVAVATEQLSWPTVLAHMDIVLQLTEQERMKGNRPFLAFLYEELLRKSWARRAEKGDPALNISAEAQKVDKDLLDIARHRLVEALKEAGLSSGQLDLNLASAKPSPDELVSRQLAAAEAAQKQAQLVSKQLVDTQQRLINQGRVANTPKAAPAASHGQPMSNRALKTQKWFNKMTARRQDQQRRKDGRQQSWQEETSVGSLQIRVEGVSAPATWHQSAALQLVGRGFACPAHLDGLRVDDVLRFSSDSKVQALLQTALRTATKSAQINRKRLASQLHMDKPLVASASAFAEEVKDSQVVLRNMEQVPRGPRNAMQQRRNESVHVTLESLASRANELKLCSQQGSGPSVASGLKAWRAFAVSFLEYGPGDALLPRSCHDVLKYIALLFSSA